MSTSEGSEQPDEGLLFNGVTHEDTEAKGSGHSLQLVTPDLLDVLSPGHNICVPARVPAPSCSSGPLCALRTTSTPCPHSNHHPKSSCYCALESSGCSDLPRREGQDAIPDGKPLAERPQGHANRGPYVLPRWSQKRRVEMCFPRGPFPGVVSKRLLLNRKLWSVPLTPGAAVHTMS